MKKKPVLYITLASLFLHLCIWGLDKVFFSEWTWAHIPIHTALEVAGALIAFYVAYLLLTLEGRREGTSYNHQIAAALIGMGILDGLHALAPPGPAFVFLHSFATFYGGLLFAGIWLPSQFRSKTQHYILPFTISLALILGVFALIDPGWIPPMATPEGFTSLAIAMNFSGGLLLISAAIKIFLDNRSIQTSDNVLFVLHCSMFGLAALMFQESKLWDLSWWGWHLMRFLAYGVALWFAFRSDQETQRLVLLAKQTLENQAEEQTQKIADYSRELNFQQKTYEKIVNAIQDGLIFADDKGVVLYVNPVITKIFGYSEDEIVGQNVKSLMAEEISRDHDYFMQHAGENAHFKILGNYRELEGKKKSGTLFPVEIKIARIDGHSQIKFVGLIRDISARKVQERQLRETAKAEAEANRAKSDFLATMSHELRTPLNGVLGMLSLLAKKDFDAESKHKIRTADESARLLLSIINDILDYSKIESGKMELEEIDFDIEELLSKSLKPFAYKAHEKGLELILDAKSLEGKKVGGDPLRLRQILNNLISNAIKFTDKGYVCIQAELSPANEKNSLRCRCSVEDSGEGIPKDRAHRLFDSFTQADSSTTRKHGGTGLGLVICKRLVELMGGEIRFESELGRGTTFYFDMSLKPAHIEDADRAPESPAVELGLKQINALVVDDNAINREILAKQLEAWDINACCAENAEIAIECCKKTRDKPFDIILADLNMPVIDGYGFAAALSELGLSSKLVLLSSSVIDIEKETLRRLNFSGFLTKPVAPSVLKSMTKAVLSEKNAGKVLSEGALIASQDDTNLQLSADKNSGSRVLIVEDNSVNKQVVLDMLADHEIHADSVDNGLQSIATLLKSLVKTDRQYTLILMDCQMPVMDGFEASQKIRHGLAGKKYKDVPIIALTANALRGDKEKCLAAGMSDFLTKPLEESELIRILNKWLPSIELKRDSSIKSPPDSNINSTSILHTWNKEALYISLKKRSDRMVVLVNMFLDQLDERVDYIVSAIESSDSEKLTAGAHSLKGAAANLRAEKLKEICETLEQSAKNQNLQKVSSLLESFLECQLLLAKELKTFLDDEQSSNNENVL